MATPLVGGSFLISAQARISGAQIDPQGTAADPTISLPTTDIIGTGMENLGFGTASGQADILCGADYALNAGANVELDLSANGLPNVFGGTANFVKLRGLFVGIVTGGDAAGVTVGGAATNAASLFFGANTATWNIFPSGAPMIGGSPAGVTVDGTHKNLKILNNGAVAVTVRLILAGTSV